MFGSQPYIQAPLTFDHQTLRTLLFEAGLGMAGRATAIGDAIGLAVKRLRERPQQHRVLILLTDGANTAGNLSPRKARDIAADSNVRIHTIGIGAETAIRQGLFGRRQVNPSSDLDEALLRMWLRQPAASTSVPAASRNSRVSTRKSTGWNPWNWKAGAGDR